MYNWFQAENNNMNILFLMSGNIYSYSLASEQYSWDSNCWLFGCSQHSAYAIPPNPPASTNTINGEQIFAQSYINAYNTAFNQPVNYQVALYAYAKFSFNDVNNDQQLLDFASTSRLHLTRNPITAVMILYLELLGIRKNIIVFQVFLL